MVAVAFESGYYNENPRTHKEGVQISSDGSDTISAIETKDCAVTDAIGRTHCHECCFPEFKLIHASL